MKLLKLKLIKINKLNIIIIKWINQRVMYVRI
jgi:hypothetical protein